MSLGLCVESQQQQQKKQICCLCSYVANKRVVCVCVLQTNARKVTGWLAAVWSFIEASCMGVCVWSRRMVLDAAEQTYLSVTARNYSLFCLPAPCLCCYPPSPPHTSLLSSPLPSLCPPPYLFLHLTLAIVNRRQVPSRSSSSRKREKGKSGRLRKALSKVSKGRGGGATGHGGGDLDAAMAINPFGGGGGGRRGSGGGPGEAYDVV